MIFAEDILESLAEVLKNAVNCRIYRNEVIEGFKPPCFFMRAKINDIEFANKNTVKVLASVEVTYWHKLFEMQKIRDEKEIHQIQNKLIKAFLKPLAVKDRKLHFDKGQFSFGGENGDILRFDTTVAYFDNSEEVEEKSTIQEISIKTEGDRN